MYICVYICIWEGESFLASTGEVSTSPSSHLGPPVTKWYILQWEAKSCKVLTACGHGLLAWSLWFRWGWQWRHLLWWEISKAKAPSISISFKGSLCSSIPCTRNRNVILPDSVCLWRDSVLPSCTSKLRKETNLFFQNHFGSIVACSERNHGCGGSLCYNKTRSQCQDFSLGFWDCLIALSFGVQAL